MISASNDKNGTPEVVSSLYRHALWSKDGLERLLVVQASNILSTQKRTLVNNEHIEICIMK